MPPLSVQINETSTTSLAEFEAIKLSSITSCPLDPLPVNIFERCLSELLPTITNVVNMPLFSGMFPTALKHARITPLLKKKTTLDATYSLITVQYQIYLFWGKIAVQQLQKYLTDNHLHARPDALCIQTIP